MISTLLRKIHILYEFSVLYNEKGKKSSLISTKKVN